MKAGIITFHRAINYGAVLQCYALCNTIKILGHNCEIIDYRCESIENQYSPLYPLKNSRSLKYSVYVMINKFFPMAKKKRIFDKFIDKYLDMSESYTKDNICTITKKYDKFITGSDQVWNYNHSNFDKNYFLDFVDDSSKKCSYAASIGLSSIPDNVREEYIRLLKDFAHISVREATAKILISNLLPSPQKNIHVSADPALLLTKNDWTKLMTGYKNKYGKYVLVYELIPSVSLLQYAQKYAKENNCKVIRIISEGKEKHADNVKNLYGVSPQQFLGLIDNAHAVFTNSFHGTAFSLNFGKNVFVETLKGTYASLNSRIYDLLELCHATDRIITDHIGDIDAASLEIIKQELEKKREEGLAFLQDILADTNHIKQNI